MAKISSLWIGTSIIVGQHTTQWYKLTRRSSCCFLARSNCQIETNPTHVPVLFPPKSSSPPNPPSSRLAFHFAKHNSGIFSAVALTCPFILVFVHACNYQYRTLNTFRWHLWSSDVITKIIAISNVQWKETNTL